MLVAQVLRVVWGPFRTDAKVEKNVIGAKIKLHLQKWDDAYVEERFVEEESLEVEGCIRAGIAGPNTDECDSK